MNVVTLSEARHNLEHLIDRTIADAEPTIICSDAGKRVVFMSLDEFNSWKETLYLLSGPANAAHLRQSIAEVAAGQTQERDLVGP